jgi:DNA-binding transcriptional LysR family regulator
MLDLRRLQVLRTVAAAGSIAGAAKVLHVSASAVSQQLALLEREAGVALVNRSRHGVTLTAAGSRLAGRAERIEQELLAARRDLAELTADIAGIVQLAVFQSVMRGLVVPALGRIEAAYPGVQVKVVETYGPAVSSKLVSGELDAAIIERDSASPHTLRRGLRETMLLRDPYRLVVPPGWHLEPRRLVDLTERPWVAGPPGTSCDVALRRLLDRLPSAGPVLDTCQEFPSVLALVAGGRGAAVVPQLAVDHPDVVVADNLRLGARRISVAYRHGAAGVEPAVSALVQTLATHSRGSR